MKISDWVLVPLVISFVLLSWSLVVGNLIDTYDSTASLDQFNSTVFDRINDTYDVAEQMREDILEGDTEEGAAWESLIKGAYSSIKLIGKSLELLHDMVSETLKEIGIPSFVINFAITAMLILILFGIIYMAFRFKS